MRPIYCILAIAVVAGSVSGQRRQGGRRGGARRQGRQEAQADYGAPLEEYAAASEQQAEAHEGDHQGLDWLLESVPGTPGDDYPILAEVPETAFSCDGQVEGGYYADTETECQAFHVCTTDGLGGLSKYSFLCPNGTIFNQAYFICDWWFNFDCAEAEGLYGRNDEIAAEQQANSIPAEASDTVESYAAPEAPLDDYAAREGRQGRRQGRRGGRRGN